MEKSAIENEIERIQRTMILINEQNGIPVAHPPISTEPAQPEQTEDFQPFQQVKMSGPEMNACREILNNNSQIEEIQKLLNSIK